jgi:hypothetical protein
MQLVWNLHPQAINVQVARSAAYQYRLQEWNDGQAELTVQHRGDRPSAKPVKNFVYKNRNGAFGGAQRFEDRHGYSDPVRHTVADRLPDLPEPITDVLHLAQSDALTTALSANCGHVTQDAADEVRAQYQELCASVLCCAEYNCYNRTDIDAPRCAEHNETTED